MVLNDSAPPSRGPTRPGGVQGASGSTPEPLSRVADRAGHEQEHAQAVRAMFGGLAGSYDTVNRLLTAGLDARWRKRAIATLGTLPAGPVVDVCAGTLDLAAALERTLPDRPIVAIDFSAEMLARGAHKVRRVQTLVGDALHLPLESESVAGLTCGFGLRNLSDPLAGIDEMARVLRPGGRLVILEFFGAARTGLIGPVTRAFHRVFGETVLPMVGRAVAGNGSAYRYLAHSMASFMTREDLVAQLWNRGFSAVCGEDLTLGVASVVSATRTEVVGG